MSTNNQLVQYAGTQAPSSIEQWQSPEWERLWLATLERHWQSLALVPAGPGADSDFTVRIAMMLARTGMTHLSRQIHVADATTLRLSNNGQFLTQMKVAMTTGPVLVAMASCADNPVTAPLARRTNGVLLCAQMGNMKLRDASRTVEEIGRQHFIGSVAFT